MCECHPQESQLETKCKEVQQAISQLASLAFITIKTFGKYSAGKLDVIIMLSLNNIFLIFIMIFFALGLV